MFSIKLLVTILIPFVIGQCPSSDWKTMGNKCYYFKDIPLTYDENVEFCDQMKGSMVSIQSESENELLTKNLEPYSGYWIGMIRVGNDSKSFKWTDGSNVTYSSWKTGQPDEVSTEKYWAAFVQNGEWYDTTALTNKFVMCQRSIEETGMNITKQEIKTDKPRVDTDKVDNLEDTGKKIKLDEAIPQLLYLQKEILGRLTDIMVKLNMTKSN